MEGGSGELGGELRSGTESLRIVVNDGAFPGFLVLFTKGLGLFGSE